MIRFILLTVTILTLSGFSNSEIDFLNKKINKEIPKIFNVKEFELSQIDNNNLSAITGSKGKYFAIKSNDILLGYSYVGRVNSCRAGGCSVSDEMSEERGYEYFDYFIVFDTEIKIMSVKVFNYQATHGHEITAKSWLKQFDNYNGSEQLVVGKNIDAISGATISTHAITYDIQNKSELLKLNQ